MLDFSFATCEFTFSQSWPESLYKLLESVLFTKRQYLVSNDTLSTVSKFIKCEICQQKTTNPPIIEKHVLVISYFYAYVSHVLGFDLNDMVKFDIKYFFLEERVRPKVILLLIGCAAHSVASFTLIQATWSVLFSFSFFSKYHFFN